MSAGKQISIGEFAEKEIPDLKTRTRFLGVMLGRALGYNAEKTEADFQLAKDDIVWSFIEKYEAIRARSNPAFLFAEREISDPAIKEIFLQLAPKLLHGQDISDIVESNNLYKGHIVWTLLDKYFKEFFQNIS